MYLECNTVTLFKANRTMSSANVRVFSWTPVLIRSPQSPLSLQRKQIGPIIIRYFVRSEIYFEVFKYSHWTFCMQDVSETLGQTSVANFAHQNRGEKFLMCPRTHFPRYSPKLSPDPSPFDPYLWRQCKALVYSLQLKTKRRFNRPGTSESLRQSVIRRVHACIDLGGGRMTICCEFWLDKLW
jgi:hypothetical protein